MIDSEAFIFFVCCELLNSKIKEHQSQMIEIYQAAERQKKGVSGAARIGTQNAPK